MKTIQGYWHNLSLASKIGSLANLLVMLTVLMLTFLSIQREQENFRTEMENQAEIFLQTTALNIRDELYLVQIDDLTQTAQIVKKHPDMTVFMIYDKNGKILVDSSKPGPTFSQEINPLGKRLIERGGDKPYSQWEKEGLVAGTLVRLGNQTIGAVSMTFSTRRLDEKISSLTKQGVVLVLVILFVGAVLTFWLARQITTPLSELARVAAQMAEGNLSIRVDRQTTDEIGKLGKAFNQMAEAIQHRDTELRDLAAGLEAVVAKRTAELRHQNKILEEMAISDPLTKAFNRRQFFKMAEKEMERAQRYHRPLAVAIIDIDYFKDINDSHGHQTGDLVLINLVNLCHQKIRNLDIFARYGGEEFVILMPESSPEAATTTIERLRITIKETNQLIGGNSIHLTVSGGIACWDTQEPLTVSSLLAHADQALYQSKQTGRDKVTLWQKAA